MADTQMTKEERFLSASERVLKENAYKIISEMFKLWRRLLNREGALLVDEVLHSIFFLGKISFPSFEPKNVVPNEKMLQLLTDTFPRAFRLYSTQLPKRSPFSCVLDMVVHLTGERNEGDIKRKLQELKQQLSRGKKAKHLISSAMCVSQKDNSPDSVRYYGVSMSTSGPLPGKIMVAASCLSYWDNYAAGAVMTYVHNPESDFDGTIRLPESVRCQAFSLSNGAEMPPCRSCGDLFGLSTTETNGWAYGHCAEIESVSNLLKNEREIKNQVQPDVTNTDENRLQARESALKYLKDLLKKVGFTWDGMFYPNIEFNRDLITVTN